MRPDARRGGRANPFDFSPLRIAAIYALLGGLWILWSDSVVEAIVRDQQSLTRVQTAKGWFFVVASAALIYLLVDRRVRALREAERSEREARETLEAMIDASPYAMFTLDREGRVASWNSAAERLFDQPTRSIVGANVVGAAAKVSLGSPEVHDTLRFLFAQAMQGIVGTGFASRPAPVEQVGNDTRSEVRLVVGPVGAAIGGSAPGDGAAIRGAVVLARDVTDERASARERQRLAAIVEATSDLVAVVSPDRRIRYLNAAGRRLLGLPLEGSLDHFDSADFLAEGERIGAEVTRRRAAEHGVLQLERTLRRVDGTTVPVSQILIVHKGNDDAVEFVSVMARDISERLRQEATLRQSQKMEAVGRLAGGVAHDFNNLLTVIMGCAEVLRSTLPSEGGREDANEIVLASERAARLTRQLLAYSRQQVMAVDSVDVNAVVRSLLEMLRRLVGDHITIADALDPDVPHIRVDRGQFEQVIVNLVVNARDAMPTGGTVTIRTWPTTYNGGEAAGLEVRDTGIGMDEVTRSQVFEPFFTTKPLGSGTGLGLATVYGIVQQSGGEIAVESAPGNGASFRVLLPAEGGDAGVREGVERAATTRGAAQGAPAPRRGPRALVVEDDATVRRTAARMLRDDGWIVFEASSAEEGLRVVQETREIAVVLTDVEMPQGNGRDLALQLAKLPLPPRVVFMSGYTTDALMLRGSLPAHATFVSKPFTSASLRTAMREALAGIEGLTGG